MSASEGSMGYRQQIDSHAPSMFAGRSLRSSLRGGIEFCHGKGASAVVGTLKNLR